MDRALYKALTYEIYVHLTSIPFEVLPKTHQYFVQFLGNDNNLIVTLNYDILVQQLHAEYPLIKGEKYSGLAIFVEDVFDEGSKTSQERPWVLEDVHDENVSKKLSIRRDFIAQIDPNDFTKLIEETGAARWASHSPARLLEKYQREYLFRANPTDTAFHKRILKLHGSVAWSDNASDASIRVLDENGTPRWDHIPVIVPPVLDKSQHYSISRLKEQWANAHIALEQANEIVIIGFSFPATDISCQFLFQSALRSRNDVRVVVVNNDRNIRDRYDPIFRHLAGVGVDYSYSGHEKSLTQYIEQDVLRGRIF